LRVEEMVAEGKCLAREEGKVIFIQGAAPGDVVDVKLLKEKKSFAEGVVTHFHSYSPDRVTPFCEHFGVCGGCKWQHLAYETQLKYKQQQVQDAFQHLAKVEFPPLQPILASKDTSFYRNKLEYTFSSKRWLTFEEMSQREEAREEDERALGFHIPGRFDKVIDIRNCYLQPAPSNAIRLAVNAWARQNGLTFFNLYSQEGFLRNLIIRTANTGQVMVIVQVAEDRKTDLLALLDHLKEQFPEITSLQWILNQKKNETYHDLEVNCYHGSPYIFEEMEGLQFRVGPKSFYQTNAAQAYELYKITREFAGLTGKELLYDLYTGAGTIASFVAGKCREVVGIEYVPSAIEDAKINAAHNSIANTTFYAGDMAEVLNNELIQRHGKPDVIITDPPRAGMHPDVIAQLLEVAAPKIVYVSCNPSTQARDLAMLDAKYQVTKVQPVDMFPQTHHVENVALLELRTDISTDSTAELNSLQEKL
jgi:23S rRNA (uracil1939-C5)-methyltransferase